MSVPIFHTFNHPFLQTPLNPAKSQYAAASRVPLIQSPSLRVPRPVELPPDIHPLPESVNPYFVYPFTLEPHILAVESNRRATIAAHAVKREAYLRTREEDKLRRKREALRRIAPGFEPLSAPLVPVKQQQQQQQHSSSGNAEQVTSQIPDVMDDLVDKLAALESAASDFH
ncbi:hypothetical protein B0F90DRAFT_1625444 [Multifurca ochricompacta]|uniref:Uncharacterized protein n=1 Tax=Multifurca ochricompacta TaxID=376703 RepID=A0AAD4M7D3_9AGAM|nr:hypothetical protein B0F90DRAFT_1625444 [Multifurca ochricompacta]